MTQLAVWRWRLAKEVARHLLHCTGALPYFRKKSYLQPESLRDRFQDIYDHKVWRTDGQVGSLSGIGSDPHATETVRVDLERLLARLHAETLLDLGCGDFSWMKLVDLRNIRYIGVDVVPTVIQANQEQYGTSRREFVCLDATAEPLLEVGAKAVILCREVLFHLSFEDIAKVCRNAASTGAEYFIATTDHALRFNSDIRSGDYRLLNLSRRPFEFPKPFAEIRDDRFIESRVLGVWKFRDLGTALLPRQ